MINRFRNKSGDINNAQGLRPGSFLIATSALHSSPFKRAVVFVLQNDSEGTFGAVINRPADREIVANWSRQTGLEFAVKSIVQGGPMGGPVLALHQRKPIAEVEISGGVCMSVDAKAIQELSHQTEQDARYRIILGIAGWEQEQLSKELATGLWFPLVVDPRHVFDDHDFMWENFVREFGRQTLAHIVGSDRFPENPALN